uniref:LRRCT domain-containing protein n=1 Tax=Panagrolaimus superbus TaxID=310955 RepID=A0A914Y675_9BILA
MLLLLCERSFTTLYLVTHGFRSVVTFTLHFIVFSLTILRLRHNPITIYPKAVNSISTLQELDLSYSIINILNQTMMGKNEHLSSLIIHSSEISKIEDCTFCEFSNLTKLHLYKNPKLSFIDENAFGYAKNETVSKLKSFSLEYCNFTVIPEKLLNWHNVGEFGIVGNPFNCTCEMSWLIDDILNPYHTMNLGRIADSYPEETLVCKTPQKYGNLAFYKINKNYCKSEKHENGQSSETSFFIGFLIVAGLIFFVFAVPLCRYLLRLRKQKTLFNYAENKVNEDFDNNA